MNRDRRPDHESGLLTNGVRACPGSSRKPVGWPTWLRRDGVDHLPVALGGRIGAAASGALGGEHGFLDEEGVAVGIVFGPGGSA
jgi:hypothetical protein